MDYKTDRMRRSIMLRLFPYVLSVFAALLILQSDSYARGSKRDSILMVGKVFNNDERVKGLIINIYNENNFLRAIHIRSAHHFRFYLPKNMLLTIEITAPGFHTKRFIFDSHVPDELKQMPNYDFDMDIFSEAELQGVNTSLLDFPSGIVSFNTKKGIFEHDKAYTKRIKKQYFQLLEEAQMSERGTLGKDD